MIVTEEIAFSLFSSFCRFVTDISKKGNSTGCSLRLVFPRKYFSKLLFASVKTFPLPSTLRRLTVGRHSRLLVNLGVKVPPGKSAGQRSQVNFWRLLTVLRAPRVNFQEGLSVDFLIFPFT